jgi:transcriptional regulator of acetoin/glycerol metabolism
LENVIERAMVLATAPAIQQSDLPFQLTPKVQNVYGDSLSAMERTHIEAVLLKNNWNISRSAEILEIDRVTLYNKISKYGLKKP